MIDKNFIGSVIEYFHKHKKVQHVDHRLHIKCLIESPKEISLHAMPYNKIYTKWISLKGFQTFQDMQMDTFSLYTLLHKYGSVKKTNVIHWSAKNHRFFIMHWRDAITKQRHTIWDFGPSRRYSHHNLEREKEPKTTKFL